MHALSGKIASVLERFTGALESRAGRTAFWAVVIAAGLALGSLSVIRAEIPQERFVEKPSYRSPVEIGRDDRQVDYHSSEFRGFRALSWGAIVEGLDQYRDLHTRGYPPFFAIAFFPFAVPWRWPGVGSAMFFLVGYGGSIVSAWCLAKWCTSKGKPAPFGLFALIWILTLPLTAAVLARCESDMLVLLPLAAALLLLVRGERPLAAGALLGFAASFKVFPALFGVYLIAQRRWRALLGMIAAEAVCMVLLPVAVWGPGGAWRQHRSWFAHVIAPYVTEGTDGVIKGSPYRSANQSLTAAAHRFLRPIPAGKGADKRTVNFVTLSAAAADHVALALKVLVAVGLLALWMLCWRRDDSPAAQAALFATVPLGMLLIGDPSLTTHHAVLPVSVGVITARALCLGDRAAQEWLGPLAAAGVICLAGASLTVRMFSPFLVTTLIVFAATVTLVIHDHRPAGTQVRER